MAQSWIASGILFPWLGVSRLPALCLLSFGALAGGWPPAAEPPRSRRARREASSRHASSSTPGTGGLLVRVQVSPSTGSSLGRRPPPCRFPSAAFTPYLPPAYFCVNFRLKILPIKTPLVYLLDMVLHESLKCAGASPFVRARLASLCWVCLAWFFP